MKSKLCLDKATKKYMKKVGDNLRCARLRAKLSQFDLAKEVGLTQIHISRLEWGDQQLKLGVLDKLCKILNVMPQEMVDPTIDGRFWVRRIQEKGGGTEYFRK